MIRLKYDHCRAGQTSTTPGNNKRKLGCTTVLLLLKLSSFVWTDGANDSNMTFVFLLCSKAGDVQQSLVNRSQRQLSQRDWGDRFGLTWVVAYIGGGQTGEIGDAANDYSASLVFTAQWRRGTLLEASGGSDSSHYLITNYYLWEKKMLCLLPPSALPRLD